MVVQAAGAGPISLDGRVAIVTAGGSGIGAATACMLAERGAQVVVNDADGEAARCIAERIEAGGGLAVAEASAIGSGDFAEAIVATALDSFGRLDILVNNAGISRPAPFGADSDDDIARVLAVNLKGPYVLMRAAWPHLARSGQGRIVNTSSSAALGSGASGAYAPSKASIIGLTMEAALSGGDDGICVNAIMPSASTRLLDKHPDPSFRQWMARHFAPEHVAAMTACLCAPQMQASGRVFTVGGGLTAQVRFMRGAEVRSPHPDPDFLLANMVAMDDFGAPLALTSQADLQDRYFEVFPLA